MKTIILYGELARRFGKTHRFAVKNAAEAIRALRVNCRGFEQFFSIAHRNGMGFKVFVGGHSLDYAEVPAPIGKAEVIRFVPAIMGSGNGWVRVLVGAVLIAGGAALMVSGVGGPLGLALVSAGIGLVIGGVTQLLTKPPSAPNTGTGTQEDRKPSYLFNGPQNVTSQGRPVPIVYGRMFVGSAVVSAGIEAHEI